MWKGIYRETGFGGVITERLAFSISSFLMILVIVVASGSVAFAARQQTLSADLAPGPAVFSGSATLSSGDARSFPNSPDVIAYANTDYVTEPDEFFITTGGTIWRSNEWIALMGSGSWVEADTTISTTTVGIQFWGDSNDGWATVYVDDSEAWKGNTYGTDGYWPGGAFVKYLEISGLPSTSHTIRVESTYGEDVTIYFFGMEKSGTSTPSPTPTALPSPTATPSAGLIAYYPLDGDASDYSGNGKHATLHGGTFVSGAKGQAVSLDGQDDYISVPININPSVMPQLTITAWAQATQAYGTLISHDNGGFDRTIDIDNRGGGLGWSAFSGSGAVVGYHPVTPNEWVFVAAVWDQTAQTVKLYVNDLLYQEAGSLGSGWDYFNIGSNPSFGGYLSGLVDEVRVYNYDLSQSEITSLRMSVPLPTSTPSPIVGPAMVAYYPFDGDYQDHSSYGNHGTAKGNMTFASAQIGQGAKFDGVSWIEVADSNSLDLYNAYTFSVRVYKENAGVGGYSVILEKADSSAMDNRSPYGFAHTPDGYNPVVHFAHNNQLTTISSDTRTNFKEWNSVTVTWDGTNVRFYINGTLKATKAWSNPLPNSASKLLIGCGPVGATEYFVGILDELRIYNYALSQSEVSALPGVGGVFPVTPTPLPTPSPTPTPIATSIPTPSPTPLPSDSPSVQSGLLTFASGSGPKGATAKLSLNLSGVSEKVGNMDITVSYDPTVLQSVKVNKGTLASRASFDSNIQNGTIRIALFDTQGVFGDGSVAEIEFTVLGAAGSTSPLNIISLAANRSSDSAAMAIGKQNGNFTVLAGIKGDCDGDGKLGTNDALCVLQMAVGKRTADIRMDMNGDGRVSSVDARKILRAALGLEVL